MIWICIEYSDGKRIYHIFKRALLYICNGRQHVYGNALCGTSFSHDTSGQRTDVVSPLIIGVDADHRLAPMDHCEDCHMTRMQIASLATLRVN